MGAGQIGGIATLLDMDFKNPAGFVGDMAPNTEAQYLVHFLSHSMLFCLGAIIEAHVMITPAICVMGEKYKFGVFSGTHRFVEHAGIERQISHICKHRGYNRTNHWSDCTPNMQIAIMMTTKPFSFHERENSADFIINRLRYGTLSPHPIRGFRECVYHGFGSRRNGYLIPLLIDLRRHRVTVHPPERCASKWNYLDTYLCIDSPPCLSEKYGALCPDDVGSVVVCDGIAKGMMISRLVDRPCGTGFVDLEKYKKFIMCGVDDSREVLHHDEFMMFDFTTPSAPPIITPSLDVLADIEASIEKKIEDIEEVEPKEEEEKIEEDEKIEEEDKIEKEDEDENRRRLHGL